jgi:hypothetical protein
LAAQAQLSKVLHGGRGASYACCATPPTRPRPGGKAAS